MPRRSSRRAALACLGTTVTTALAGCAGDRRTDSTTEQTPETTTSTDDVRLVAHRGCAGQYLENTTLAARRSAPHVDAVEVDVQRCGSGELVVFHDDRLDRVTDATGDVSTTDWETLRDLTVLDSEQTIPRLSDLLAAVPADTDVRVELKHAGMASDALAVAETVENEVRFSSFSGDALRELHAAASDVETAYLFSDSPDISLSIAADVGCSEIHPNRELVTGSSLVETAHEQGFSVTAWTVATESTADALVAAGVDGLIVDRWDVL